MSEGAKGERRTSPRYQATLHVRFKYAGKAHRAITTDVSPTGANIVCGVRLPPGAMIVLEIINPEPSTADRGRLIGQVVWSGPAPFGGGDSAAAGLQMLGASAGTWARAVEQAINPDAEARPPRPLSTERPPSLDRAAQPSAAAFQALFQLDGAWFRGEIVTGTRQALWVRCGNNRPAIGSPMRLRVAISDGQRRGAIVVDGHVPVGPLPDPRSRGWIFEMEVSHSSHPDLFARLVTAMSHRAAGAKGANE